MNSKKITPVEIDTEYIKLDSFLKFAGESQTGGQTKEQIAAGEVWVNGEICTMRGKKLRPGDNVTVNGRIYEVKVRENQ